jgi:AcrR family transcriptional regulator
MKSAKRLAKEDKILDAAERVFADLGFRNTRMEDVAKAVGMSKGNVYFYFESKENLFMAVTYRAFRLLFDRCKEAEAAGKEGTGKEAVVQILKAYLDFCDEHPGYFELLMNYMGLVRMEQSPDGAGLSEALVNSHFYQLIKEIQNEPFKITVNQITRGQNDGSIPLGHDPCALYLTAWAMVVGFREVASLADHGNQRSVLQVPVSNWKDITFDILVGIMDNPDQFPLDRPA